MIALMMTVHCYQGGPVETNGYLLVYGDEVLLVDAPEGVADYARSLSLSISKVLITHQHFDHVADVARLQKEGAEVWAFSQYSEGLTLERGAREWGIPIQIEPFQVDYLIEKGAALFEGGMTVQCLHVPGHSPDSVCFYFDQHKALFSGDTLFKQGVGRTDLPEHGDEQLLLTGIQEKLLSLPRKTMVYPGHGEATIIEKELEDNPFFF